MRQTTMRNKSFAERIADVLIEDVDIPGVELAESDSKPPTLTVVKTHAAEPKARPAEADAAPAADATPAVTTTSLFS